MGTYRAFLVGFILAVVAGQQPSGSPMLSVPTYKFQGRVIKQSGDWIQIYSPQIVDSQDNVLFKASFFDPQSGAFAFAPLPAGTYAVRVGGMRQEDGDINQAISIKHKVIVASNRTDVDLALTAGISIPVTVRKEGLHQSERCWWDPLAEKFHSADCSGLKAAQVELIPVDSRRTPYLSGPGVVNDPTHFGVHGVEPGKYVVRVELPSFPANYVQSVTSGNLDLLHEELNVPEDGSVSSIEIIVRDDFARVKVQTRGAARQPGIVFLREDVLLAAPAIPRCNETTSTCSVAPGSYAIFIFDPFNGTDTTEELVSKYATRAVHVTVPANQTRAVDVDVIHIREN